jgi:hypothetical protein
MEEIIMKRLLAVLAISCLVLFAGAIPWSIDGLHADEGVKCNCKAGKGDCKCKDGDRGCNCGKDCKCGHCKDGKGDCKCKAGDKGCSCGKDCKCGHCKDGKGGCKCGKGKGKGKGCNCGKDCKCGHCTSEQSEEAKKPATEADYAKTMQSKAGTFKVEYSSDPADIPVNAMLSWKLKVQTADGQAVKDAEITVSGDMPEHGHGLPTQPKVTKNLGDGSYVVDGIKFSMPGWWTMTFTIKAGGKTDTVTFNLKLK